MLRMLRIRSKLMTMLAAPLVAVVIFAFGDVSDRRAEAREKARSAHLAQLTVAANRLLAEARTEPDGGAIANLADEFASLAEPVLAGHYGAGMQEDARRVTGAIGGLADGAGIEPLSAAVLALVDRVPTRITGEGLADSAAAYGALGHLQALVEQRASFLVALLTRSPMGTAEVTRIGELRSSMSLWAATFARSAEAQPRADVEAILASDAALAFGRAEAALLGRPAGPQPSLAADVSRAAEQITGELGAVENLTAEDFEFDAVVARAEAEREALLGGTGAALVIFLALGLAMIVARGIVRPVRRLTDAAYAVSQVQLPAMLAALENPGAPAVAVEPVVRESQDEIGDLADAFTSIQQSALEVAERQSAMLRTGVSELFVNLARRNQSLIERQLAYLDGLQADEEDPKRLEELFRVDHLSVRMRRNSESLLVLAGSDQTRRWSKDTPLSSVLRAAYGEAEHMSRIDVSWAQDVNVAGAAVTDTVHIIAELLENATAFSAPATRVELTAHQAGNDFIVTVTDAGVGMSETRLNEANATLAQPPVPGLALSRSLGFVVVSRLAARHGIRVVLANSPSGGLVVNVLLPAGILRGARVETGNRPAAPSTLPVSPAPVVTLDDGPPEPTIPELTAAPSGPAVRAAQSDGRTASGLPRRGSLASAPEPVPTATDQPEATAVPAAEAPSNGATTTASGLARRTAGASRAVPVREDHPDEPVLTRSADEKRELLSTYWQGLDRGRAGSDHED